MKKILAVGLGGTIACERKGSIVLGKNPFKVLEYINNADDYDFTCVSPFSVLSENIGFEHLKKLKEFFDSLCFEEYDGVVVLHGSDTLSFTAAFLFNLYNDKKIVLTASGKPLGEAGSNGAENFENALRFLEQIKSGVYVSYDGIYKANELCRADENDKFISIESISKPVENPALTDKKVLIINPHPGIDYSSFSLSRIDAVLHTMYHSATVPSGAFEFCEICKGKNIPFYFVTSKKSAEYESSSFCENILFGMTLEDAFSKILLTNGELFDNILKNK